MTLATKPDGVASLTHWALLRAQGADAQSFLQGQLTNDVTRLGAQQIRIAGYCSAKGRLQASFLVWREAPDAFMLACSASLMPALLKRLSMFVLRARCQLSDATATRGLFGALGASATALAGDTPAWSHAERAAGTVLRLPDVRGVTRCVIVSAAQQLPGAPPVVSLDAWRRLEVRSGIPTIEAATVDQFVPQMLNYELIGGVDFTKGCYPGQEVVARSHYRGTLKRRMFLFDGDAAAQSGQELFHSADPAQPAGMVVNAAPREDGVGSSLLCEVKLDAMADGSLHLGAVDGAVLRRDALPYDVPLPAATAT